MTPRVSVIVCTMRRAGMLRRTLESLLDQSAPPSAYEIVVVDNDPDDDTRRVVDELRAGSGAHVEYLPEPAPGLSRARNRGIRAVRGDIVAFIDDDATAAPTWIAALVEAFSAPEGPDAAGGPVVAAEPFEQPSWLPDRLLSHLSVVDHGDREKRLRFPHLPFGTNMAFRRSILDGVGLFDTRLGRIGPASFRTSEETDLFMRIETSGAEIRYLPGLLVHHTIAPERLSRPWILRQTANIGVAEALIERKARPFWHIAARVLVAPIQILAGLGAWAIGVLIRRPRIAMLGAGLVRNRLGYLRGALAS
jgi:glucosyl-dolichyl phosphate glucuronosyltransferase